MNSPNFKGGVWSATPTPFTPDLELDVPSIKRLVKHHIEMGVTGIMLAGTCGEGPWMRDRDRELLSRTTVEAAAGKLTIALQVTDNSAVRVLEQIDRASRWGIQIAVVSAPYFILNATEGRILAHHKEVLRRSILPVGFYDLGEARANPVPEALLPELLAEPNLALIKDSAASKRRRNLFLAARLKRPNLLLLNGDEFNCVRSILDGYDGLLLGGGIFNASLASRIIVAARSGNAAEADKIQSRMNVLMHSIYGGPKIECWLTGLKELLVQMGIFQSRVSLLEYPLSDFYLAKIRAVVDGSDGLGFSADLRSPTELLRTP